jgi:AcrR family transcriptional regulator
MARTRAAEIAREVTERELLGAALEIFVKKGYHAATIADIVAAAGVTQGTFYLYFKNKAHIFSALLAEYREQTIAGLFSIDLAAVTTKKDWLHMTDRISDFLIAHINTHGDFMRLFMAEETTIKAVFPRETGEFSAGIIAEIGSMVRHGIKMNLLKNVDIEAYALSVFGAIKEAIDQSFIDHVAWPPENIIPRVIRCQAELILK